jgi:cholest-4-en-3-one 26-monooxygenase
MLPGVRVVDGRPVADLLDPHLYGANPHDLWTWMRHHEPVYRDARNGLWAVTRHHDLMDVERRSNVFVSGAGYRAIWSPEEINMIAQDDPRHRQQRMMVQHHFTRAATSAQRDAFGVTITQLINAVIDDGEMEVVDAIAGQLPARLTCRLMGFPEDRWRDLKSWSERLMRIDMRERDGATWDEFVNANMEFANALGELVPPRIGCPHNDLISDWVNGTIDGQSLSPAAIVHETGLFISGGAETTRTLISHGLRTFCDHPDQWEAMAADPSLVPGAVEELLRWVTPLNQFFRRAMADDHIGDQPVRRGDRVILLYPSANRDETVFERPFEFDIRRRTNQHLAFGFGTHLCLGANFARTELNELFTQLPQRITNLRVLSEPDVEDNIFARAVRSFRLGFDVRATA